MEFRKLTASEIDCRIGNISKDDKGLSLLLYKDARVDMNILDEAVGPMNWQKSYSRDNKNCTVSIWDADKGQWISKEDTGTESNTEAEKGLASDSFKRACFNWGIGRELYSAPFIWLSSDKCNIKDKKCYDSFKVTHIAYINNEISELEIVNAKTGDVVYKMGGKIITMPKPDKTTPAGGLTEEQIAELKRRVYEDKIDIKIVHQLYKHERIEQYTQKEYENMMKNWDKVKARCRIAEE